MTLLRLPLPLRAAFAALLAVLASLVIGLASARAVVEDSTGGHGTGTACPTGVPCYGVMPMMAGSTAGANQQDPVNTGSGTVLGGVHVYVIYWDPVDPPKLWPIVYPQSTKLLIGQYLDDVAADSNTEDNTFAMDPLYNDAGNTAGTTPGYEIAYMGAWADQVTPYPTTGGCSASDFFEANACLTDAQIQAELNSYIAGNGLPTGRGDVYLMATPPGVVTCLDSSETECSEVAKDSLNPQTLPTGTFNDSTSTLSQYVLNNNQVQGGFCGYHSYFSSSSGAPVYYGDIPWPYPNIIRPQSDVMPGEPADYWGIMPLDTIVEYAKYCQPDGGGVLNLPNGNMIDQPVLSNGGGVEVDFGDVLINIINHVLNATITDPQLNAFQDDEYQELPDKCEAQGSGLGSDPDAWFILEGSSPSALQLQNTASQPSPMQIWDTINTTFASGDTYDLQSMFNTVQQPDPPSGQCVPYAQLTPRFKIPATVDPNQLIGFDPSPTIATLGGHIYTWNFGDGSPAVTCNDNPVICNPSVFHAYTVPGVYTVTLTVTDFTGVSSSATAKITVLGTPPTSTTGGGGGSGGGTQTSTSTGSGPSGTPALAPPKITQALVKASVSNVLKHGLSVKYSVSEEVAGHFQVLLDAKTARKLHIKGTVVSGVKVAGQTRPILIGTALLVTSKAGSNKIAIKLTKAAAAKLKKTKSLPVTVRLTVHNLAGATVAAQTAITLRG